MRLGNPVCRLISRLHTSHLYKTTSGDWTRRHGHMHTPFINGPEPDVHVMIDTYIDSKKQKVNAAVVASDSLPSLHMS